MPSGVIYPIGTITADGINMGVAIVDLELIFLNPTDMNTYSAASSLPALVISIFVRFSGQHSRDRFIWDTSRRR
jgi:hypothetical protein